MKKIIISLVLILLFCFKSITLATVEIPDTIKVGIFYGSSAKSKIILKTLTDTTIYGVNTEKEDVEYEVEKKSTIRLEIDDNKNIEVYINDVLKDKLKGEVIIDPNYDYKNDNRIILESKEYRGKMLIKSEDDKLAVINDLSMQHYLYSVVPSEIEATSPIEAIKAQAVAARTYTIAEINRHKSDGFNLCSNIHCQMYRGTEWERDATRKAVDDTENIVITYNDKIISAFYFSSSGGYTEDVKNVWTADLPYLKAVEDTYEPKMKPWIVTYTKEELEEILDKKDIDIGEVIDMKVTEYTKSGRAYKIVFYGSKAKKEFIKETTRSLFNLKSQMYTLTNNGNNSKTSSLSYIDKDENIKEIDILKDKIYTINNEEINEKTKILTANGEKTIDIDSISKIPTEYVFTGYGNGHGIGMSQNGAKAMAQAGLTYQEILMHYYTDIVLQKKGE